MNEKKYRFCLTENHQSTCEKLGEMNKLNFIKSHCCKHFQENFDKNYTAVKYWCKSCIINYQMEIDIWVIWQYHDPRILSDYSSEVSKSVFDIFASEKKAMVRYKELKNIGKIAGSGSDYCAFPMRTNDPVRIGEKIILHKARELSDDDRWEIDHGY